jgi:YHS domain-containing protein
MVIMAQVTDPVCKMTIDRQAAQYKLENMGQTFYFCSPGCMKAFDKEPMKYISQSESSGSIGQPEHSH